MSPSSVEVTWRPAGPGHRARTARVDLTRIPDPQTWLTNRLGPLASFEIRYIDGTANAVTDTGDPDRLDAAAPVGRRPPSPPITPPQQENDQ